MQPSDDPSIATHEPSPSADFVIRVDLANHGMPGRSEQLWARQVTSNRFVVRSLPFFVYGVALDDEVETDDRLLLERVVRRSGHRVLRVAAQPEAASDVQGELHPMLERLQLQHEWHRIGFVAIDVPPDADITTLLDVLETRTAEGLLEYEFA